MHEEIIRRYIKASIVVLAMTLLGVILQLPLVSDADSTTIGVPLKVAIVVLGTCLLFLAVHTIFAFKVIGLHEYFL